MLLDLKKIPAQEKEQARQLESALICLDGYVRKFRAAIQLLDFCNANVPTVPTEWMGMAGRDGAMTLYHFDAVMEGIVSSLNKMPVTRTMIDHKVLRLARKGFDAAFPSFESFRHAVAHQGELQRDSESTKRHSFSGGYTGPGLKLGVDAREITLIDCFQGRWFTTTFEGQILTYELSPTALEQLVRIGRRFFSGFNRLLNAPVTESSVPPPGGRSDRQSV